MIGSADPRDLQPGMAAYAKNINIVKQHGILAGIPKDTTGNADTGFNSIIITKFQDEVNDLEAIALYDGTNIKYSTDYDDALPTSTNAVNGSVTRSSLQTAMVGDGISVHMGFGPNGTTNYQPVWLGYVGHDQLGVDEGTGIRAEPLTLEPPPLFTSSSKITANPDYGAGHTTITGVLVKIPNKNDDASETLPWSYDNTQNIFQMGENQKKVWVYYVSSVYDGYQEGPAKFLTELSAHKNNCRLKVTHSITGNYGSEYIETIVGWVPGTTTISGGGKNQKVPYNQTKWQNMYLGFDGTSVSDKPVGVISVEFTIWLRLGTSVSDPTLNRRITGFRVYRAERLGGKEGRAFFLKDIDINDSGWYADGEADVGDAYNSDALTQGMYTHFNFLDDDFTSPDSYEDLNYGVPLDLPNMNIRWGLSAAIDGYQIVGNCWSETLGSVTPFLFRSKRHRFDVFDWTNDLLTLPTKPTALVPYNGRLYVFSASRTYVVNPNIFDFEDTWEGQGCIAQQSAVVTDKGMFWVDKNNIYHHDGTRMHSIGSAVLKNEITASAAWENVDFAETPICCYHPVYESFIVFYKSGGLYVGLMYHIPTKRWQHIDLAISGQTINGLTGIYYNSNGIPTLVVSTASSGAYCLYLFLDTSNNRAWDFYAYQTRTANDEKYFHTKVYYNGTPPDTVEYFEDDPDYSAAQTASVVETIDSSMRRYLVNSSIGPPYKKVRGFSIRLAGSTGAEDVRHISIIRKVMRQT